jgi:hypothetical protein
MSQFDLDDINVIECDEEASIEDEACSVQRAINSGMWGLQGSYGRQMMDFITAGLCMLGEKPARDYYGNRIPSRSEVQDGTKGSRGYVIGARGEEWAQMLEGV